MPMRLKSVDKDFEKQFTALLSQKREVSADVDNAVRDIIGDVRARGDAALVDLTLKFDRLDLRKIDMTVTAAEIEAAFAECSKETLDALRFAHDRIVDHHQRQLPTDDRYRDAAGVELGHRWTAVESAGLYVPGGLASYPSSVLMNAVPAKVAGVPRIVMVVPSPAGELNPLVLAAAKIAGVVGLKVPEDELPPPDIEIALRFPDWPEMMRQRTAAAYLDLSESAFIREVYRGTLPYPVTLGGRQSWSRKELDASIAKLLVRKPPR